MKCTKCNGCCETPIIDSERYFYCWLCKTYYYWDGKILYDVTEELNNGGRPARRIQTGENYKQTQ